MAEDKKTGEESRAPDSGKERICPNRLKETENKPNGIGKTLMTAIGIALLAWWIYGTVGAGKKNIDMLGTEGAFLFNSLDVNADGAITVEEFAPIVEKLTNTIPPSQRLQLIGDGEVVTLKAYFQPLVRDTMKSSKVDVGYLPFSKRSNTIVGGLFNWTKPAVESQDFQTLDFVTFLPKVENLDVGIAWFFYDYPDDHLGNNRFYPPIAEGNEAYITRLLRMFHPKPFTQARFGPHGGVAIIRAENEDFIEVNFRFHAEFQLNDPPGRPFWFTPAMFTGNVVMTKNASRLVYFNLNVPTARELNVDMEWMNGPDPNLDVEVDIGFMPRMELESIGPSRPQGEAVQEKKTDVEEIVWKKEISHREAYSKLEKAMYPFKQVDYLPLADAFSKAKEEKKLVHSIVLWGSLDDQSC